MLEAEPVLSAHGRIARGQAGETRQGGLDVGRIVAEESAGAASRDTVRDDVPFTEAGFMRAAATGQAPPKPLQKTHRVRLSQ